MGCPGKSWRTKVNFINTEENMSCSQTIHKNTFVTYFKKYTNIYKYYNKGNRRKQSISLIFTLPYLCYYQLFTPPIGLEFAAMYTCCLLFVCFFFFLHNFFLWLHHCVCEFLEFGFILLKKFNQIIPRKAEKWLKPATFTKKYPYFKISCIILGQSC